VVLEQAVHVLRGSAGIWALDNYGNLQVVCWKTEGVMSSCSEANLL